jgi:hypothetical protein
MPPEPKPPIPLTVTPEETEAFRAAISAKTPEQAEAIRMTIHETEIIRATIDLVNGDDLDKQWAAAGKLIEWVNRKTADAKAARFKIAHHLELLLGDDLFADYPKTIAEQVERLGYGPNDDPPPYEFMKRLADADFGHKWDENLETGLLLIFEQRYGWTAEQIKKMTPQQLLLALEQVIEYTPKNKPDVFEMTK